MNFRRWITALAVLTLFVGLAAAQTSGQGATALTCNTVAQVTPTIRSEGITEMIGDIVITCQGGTYVPVNTAIPQGNIVISLTAPVTSRLASGSAPSGAAGQPSEAILMVDEPNSGLPGPVTGFGPGAPLNVCSTPGQGCVEYATSVAGTGGNFIVATDDQNPTTPAPGRNVFQGNVSGNTISFQGIPFLPPVTAGVVRVYRITNVRVNATGAGSSVVSGVQPVYAYISTNGASTLPINSNNGITVAFVSASLNGTVTAASTKFTQCVSPGLGNVALLNFAETFPSAFKTRIAPFGTTGTSYIGTSSAAYYTSQKVPGQLYGSESGFILPVNGVNAGLADFGTRFKAVFNNLPAGATIYVSNTNVTTYGSPFGAPAVDGGYNVLQTAYAKLTTGGEAGVFTGSSSTNPTLSISSGSATAIWEVVNTNTSANEIFTFAVYVGYTPNTTANTPGLTPTAATPPASGAPSVTLSYAPTSSTSAIPRFIAGTNATPWGLLNIVPCQTILLFPYVTTMGGFDTGIAISNTSQDPFGTQTSAGTCALNFYGKNAPTTALTIGPILAGTPDPLVATFQTSTLAPNYQGYLFATCNFQYAHGFAFVSDIGARNLAMGYLALIINDGPTGALYVGRTGAVAAEALQN
jgi:hypothetical protein